MCSSTRRIGSARSAVPTDEYYLGKLQRRGAAQLDIRVQVRLRADGPGEQLTSVVHPGGQAQLTMSSRRRKDAQLGVRHPAHDV
jgi:hypothetical protein